MARRRLRSQIWDTALLGRAGLDPEKPPRT
jgi:hypothetical protein